MTIHTCGRCGRLVEVDLHRCPDCGRIYPALFGWRRRLDSWFARDSSWAKSFALALVAIYLGTVLLGQKLSQVAPAGRGIFDSLSPGGEALWRCGAMIPELIRDGEWWRLFLANLLHVHPIHILFNLSSLLTLGGTIERLFGPARLTLVFVFAGAGGFLVSAFAPVATHWSAGSSSGIAALLGAMLAYGVRRKGDLGAQLRDEAIRWMIFLAIFGWLAPRVDNYAHFGGAAFGFLMALTFERRQFDTGRESDLARLGALAALALLVVCVGFAVSANFA